MYNLLDTKSRRNIVEFFENAFNWLADVSSKLPKIDFQIFFIVTVAVLFGLGIVFAFTYLGSKVFKLTKASKKIQKYLEGVDTVDDDNVSDFTAHCFSSKAPQALRDSWVQYLGVRFGYPSDIVSDKNVYDKTVKKNKDYRAGIYLCVSLVLLAIFAFWGYGTLDKIGIGTAQFIGLAVIGLMYLFLILINRAQNKRCLEAFDAMQEDLDAKVNLQVEKNYATDSSPLSELAGMVEEIIARNTSKAIDVDEEQETVQEPTPIEALIEQEEQSESVAEETPVEETEESMEETPVEETEEPTEETPVEETENEVEAEEVQELEPAEETDEATEPQTEEVEETEPIREEESVEESAEAEEAQEERAEENVEEQPLEEVVEEEQPLDEEQETLEETQEQPIEETEEIQEDETATEDVQEGPVEEDKEATEEESDENQDIAEQLVEEPVEETQEAEEADEQVEEVSEESDEEQAPTDEESTDGVEEVEEAEESEDEAEEDETAHEEGEPEENEPANVDGESEEDETEVVYVVDGEEEDDEVVKPAKLVKLPNLVDYMLSKNTPKAMKIQIAGMLIGTYKKFENSKEDRKIVVQCLTKVMRDLQAN